MFPTASTFIASVVGHGATRVTDEHTLLIGYVGGTATFSFCKSAAMRELALAILVAVPHDNDAAIETNLTNLRVDTGKKEANKEDDDGSNEDSEDGASSGSEETNDELVTPRNEDPESSFESYDGYGLTQEVNF